MATKYLPYALFVPSVGTGVNGDGSAATGTAMPAYDTLIGITNNTSSAQNVTFRFFNQDGTTALWSDSSTSFTKTIAAGDSFGTTLIPGNQFNSATTPGPSAPQFTGYGIIDMDTPMPTSGILSGGGFYPFYYNRYSDKLPVYDSLPARSIWTFPYLIPYFDDTSTKKNHSTFSYNITLPTLGVQTVNENFAFRTGMVITNFDTVQANLTVKYTINSSYTPPAQGTTYTWTETLNAGASMNPDIYASRLLTKTNYPAGFNSEGWLQITSQQPVRVLPWLQTSNVLYNSFSAGVEFI